MTMFFLLLGAVLGVLILASIPRLPKALRAPAVVGALLVFFVFFTLSSFRFVPENRVGIVVKNVGGKALAPGKIIATGGEKGPQAKVLPPGWHPWLWPIIYDVELEPVLVIEEGNVGLLTSADGQPLPDDATYAPEWADTDRKRMAEDAVFFLTDGNGYKGPQTTVLTPGSYRVNTKLFTIVKVPVTNILPTTVGVVKSNVGKRADIELAEDGSQPIVPRGQRGIWRNPLTPANYYINPKAFEVTNVSTAKQTVQFTKSQQKGDEREITVRSSDGFTFPVDVRVEYEIRPGDAAQVVATFRDDGELLLQRLTSSVRSVFRNNAEAVKALDYVQQRSLQESQSLVMLQNELSSLGVTVTAVRIGDVGDQETLGTLLQTQTDREIAVQEQITFQEQQRAAEQRKALTRTEQEAEEEKRLATAQYMVKIAEEEKRKRIIAAEAEAEAIEIQAKAQASAFEVIAQQIGAGNAALIELLKVIGEDGIEITPRVMVTGDRDGMSGGETTALIGTMLDTMMHDAPKRQQASNDGG